MDMKVIGLDPAGKDSNPTGLCVLTDYGSHTEVLYGDREILDRIKEQEPDLVAIDGPFGFPDKGYYRECDKALIERGFKPLSPKFPGMKFLVDRTMGLMKELNKEGIECIEMFPRATEKILGLSPKEGTNEHHYDALLAALTAKYYLKGEYEDLSGIVVPKT